MLSTVLQALNHVYAPLMELSRQSPVVAGAVSLWGLGVVSYLVKGVPSNIWRVICQQATTRLTVSTTDAVYYDLLTWVSERSMHGWVRSLSVTRGSKPRPTRPTYDGNRLHGSSTAPIDTDEVVDVPPLTFGYGTQYFWYRGWPVRMVRSRVEANQTAEAKEDITLTILGRSHKLFSALYNTVLADSENDTAKTLTTYIWDGYWNERGSSQYKRGMNTVHLPAETKSALVSHIDAFRTGKTWCVDNGIPWRTGVLLFGPPGTGKTSICRAIASKYGRKLYVFNLKSMTDSSLLEAVGYLPIGAVGVMEDIDALGIADTRETGVGNGEEEEEEKNGRYASGRPREAVGSVTLSGLLNAIDGPATGEGHILIATTNYPERLDPALVRSGRFDLKLKIDYVATSEFRAYMARFYGDALDWSKYTIKPNTPMSDLQALVIANKSDPLPVIQKVGVICDTVDAVE